MKLRAMPARLSAAVIGLAVSLLLALAAARPAWAEPTPENTDDTAYRAGYLFGRLLPALCCFIVIVCLAAVLVVLLRRRRDRRLRQPPPPPYSPYR
jgi:disulfide bond formation protein DsbB